MSAILGKIMAIAGVATSAAAINIVDVLWMLPFLLGPAGFFCGTVLVASAQWWASVAILCSLVMPNESSSLNCVANMTIACVALLFAVVQMLWDAFRKQEEAEQQKDTPRSQAKDEHKLTTGTFALLALTATFDLCLGYYPLLTMGAITAFEVEAGILVASGITMLLCWLVSQIRIARDLLQGLPVFLPAVFVGAMALIEGLSSM